MATTTPDQIFPSSACLLQHRLDIHGCPAFDVQAVCTGFVYALASPTSSSAPAAPPRPWWWVPRPFSRIIDWTDRGTCVLFGDGAGAVVIGADDEPGIISSCLHADGAYRELLQVPAGVGNGGNGSPYMEMKGNEVFPRRRHHARAHRRRDPERQRHDPRRYRLAGPAPGQHAHHPGDRAQARPADGAGRGHRGTHGNTSAASVPLAFDQAVRDGRIQRGQTVLMEAFGGGFTWGSVLLRY
jgi:3-oxoacyl-[acyl-carrier-protein] synthase-3